MCFLGLIFAFRVYGFYGVVGCGVEGGGGGGVSKSAMVDGFGFFVICVLVGGGRKWVVGLSVVVEVGWLGFFVSTRVGCSRE